MFVIRYSMFGKFGLDIRTSNIESQTSNIENRTSKTKTMTTPDTLALPVGTTLDRFILRQQEAFS
jgi:hypothetical protein